MASIPESGKVIPDSDEQGGQQDFPLSVDQSSQEEKLIRSDSSSEQALHATFNSRLTALGVLKPCSDIQEAKSQVIDLQFVLQEMITSLGSLKGSFISLNDIVNL